MDIYRTIKVNLTESLKALINHLKVHRTYNDVVEILEGKEDDEQIAILLHQLEECGNFSKEEINELEKSFEGEMNKTKKQILIGKIVNMKSSKEFPDKEYETLIKSLKGKSESEKREEVINQLIKEKIKFLISLEPNKKDLFLNMYDKVATQEKREEYAKELQSISQIEESNRKVKELGQYFSNQIAAFHENTARQNAKAFENMETVQEVVKYYTKHVKTVEELIELRRKNKDWVDPYRWGMRLNQEPKNFLQGTNNKGEYIVVNRLGTYQWDRLMAEPTEENPKGKYGCGETEGTEIVGITRIQPNGYLRKSEIFLARLNKLTEENLDFYINDYFSEEATENAKLNNYNYLGEGMRDHENPERYYIEYNGLNATEMLSSFVSAQFEPGVIYQKQGQEIYRDRKIFRDILPQLADSQVFYTSYLLSPKDTRKQGESEEWAK